MSEPTDLIRWGVIGCGDVVRRKSGAALRDAERSEIRAVVSRDGSSAASYAAEHDIPIATDDAERVIADPAVDAVYVATPPNSHEDYVIAAAEAGKPVLVEKPIGRSAVEAKAMIKACDRHGVELFVAYYRRFHPQVRAIRHLLRENAIGEPTHAFVDYAFPTPAESGWRETPAVSGGGWFVDATSHRLDLLVDLLGPPADVNGAVQSVTDGQRVEDIVSLSVTLSNGALCTVVSDFAAGDAVDTFRIRGTEGRLTAEVLDDGAFTYETRRESGRRTFVTPANSHDGLIDHVETVLLDGATNRCSGRSGLQTEAVLDKGVRRAYADAIPAEVWTGDLADITASVGSDSP